MASFTTGFQPPGSWHWPDDVTANSPNSGAHDHSKHDSAEEKHIPKANSEEKQKSGRHWRPRTCRICLETVLPKFQPMSEYLPNVFQSEPTVIYESEGGRLIRPCKCKGSSRYVHASCLQEWRHADPRYGRRNYWQCPTCRFQYRLERMRWGQWISSQATQVFLTLAIFVLAVFTLGFIADPIINLYFDPYSIMMSSRSERDLHDLHLLERGIDDSGWLEHFIKGVASLGLLGCIKFILMSPFRVINIRSGLASSGHRAGTTGRDRIDSVTWIVIVAGVFTFLFTVWKSVRAWSRRTLEKASEHVMDVQGDNDDDDEEEQAIPDSDK